MRFGLAWLIGCAAVSASCSADPAFQCQSDDQCVSGGVTGICQPSGYCSFVDDRCETGLRYAQSAPPGLAGQCVEPSATGSTGATSSVPSTTGTTGGSSSTETSLGTDSTTSGSTGTSSDSSDTSTSSSSSSGGGSSTTQGDTCPDFVDEFDNGVVEEAPWSLFGSDPSPISEAGSTLRFAMPPGTAQYAFVQMTAVDISSGFAVAHMVSLPHDDAAQFLLRVSAGSDSDSVELQVTGDTEIVARIDGVVLQLLDLSESATELWLEVYFTDGVASFAYSLDGNDFMFIDSAVAAGDYTLADISLVGGAFEATTAPLHFIEVDDFEFCTQSFD